MGDIVTNLLADSAGWRWVIVIILIVAVFAIAIFKDKVKDIIPLFKKGGVYQYNISGSNNTIINGDNAPNINEEIYNDTVSEKFVPINNEDRRILSNWVNSKTTDFYRVDFTSNVIFTLGERTYKFDSNRESEKLILFEEGLERMKNNGYLKIDGTKSTKHKWYTLTEKAISEFKTSKTK